MKYICQNLTRAKKRKNRDYFGPYCYPPESKRMENFNEMIQVYNLHLASRKK